ncbi:Apocytochrome f [Platanthera zijinensis]|uniref:Apocytochrome f n=1 Tax=Platanthera zijinensis TaxID=2320716 RepID=A0AAP0FX62_9ASPA
MDRDFTRPELMIGLIYNDIGLAENDQILSGLVSTFPQGYENQREATGRIVCAIFHLAKKPVDIEVLQAVLPFFEAVVRIPYDMQLKKVLANGKREL